MSDYYTKIIPADPYLKIEKNRLQEAAEYLLDKLVAMEASVTVQETPEFIDCGAYLERITCPFCGTDVFDWWIAEMKRLDKDGFADIRVTLPCCGKESTLDQLVYKDLCGFACSEVSLLYPRAEPDDACLARVRQLLGCEIRVIYSRI